MGERVFPLKTGNQKQTRDIARTGESNIGTLVLGFMSGVGHVKRIYNTLTIHTSTG